VTEARLSPDNPFTAYRKSFVIVMALADSSGILEMELSEILGMLARWNESSCTVT